MGCRSYLIAAVPGPEAVRIYCAKESQTFGLGKILNRHYNTPEKAQDLMNHGDAMYILETPEASTFHHRDFGKPLRRDRYPNLREALLDINEERDFDIEYVYLFMGNSWAVMNIEEGYTLSEPIPVTPETMADDVVARFLPAAHNAHMEMIAEGDQALAARLKKRAARARRQPEAAVPDTTRDKAPAHGGGRLKTLAARL